LHLLVLDFFFDIRSGQQWVIIATPNHREDECDADYFTQWDRYLQDFDPMNPTFGVDTALEAIQLEPGNQLQVCTHIFFSENQKKLLIFILISIFFLKNKNFMAKHTLYNDYV
jgi:hypothetical protein